MIKRKTTESQKEWLRQWLRRKGLKTSGAAKAWKVKWGKQLPPRVCQNICHELGIGKPRTKAVQSSRASSNGKLSRADRERIKKSLPALRKMGVKVPANILSQVEEGIPVRIPTDVKKRAERVLGGSDGVVVIRRRHGRQWRFTTMSTETYKGRLAGGRNSKPPKH
jgi:hypothetical protein